jgi:hypothetical protein
MASLVNPGTFHPKRVNQYVASMQYASDVNYAAGTRISFGPVAPASANNIVNAQSVVAAVTLDLTTLPDIIAPWGRCVTLTGSANVIAGSGITLRGWDWLGQPMTEQFTSVAGATPIVGAKAFKSFNSVTFGANAGTAPVTFSIGQNTKLGLPYRALFAREETNASTPVSPVGTLVPGPFANSNNNPGTVDPRGTYQPTTVVNGSAIITAIFTFVNDLFGTPGGARPNDAGGLHGFPHAG